MVTLEQVKLLENKVAKALDYIGRMNAENASLRDKLDGYQARIDELEVIVKQFRDEQGRIEDSILSALDRLAQFEDAVERGLSNASKAPDSHQDQVSVEKDVVESGSEENDSADVAEEEVKDEANPDLMSDEDLDALTDPARAVDTEIPDAEVSEADAEDSAETPKAEELDIF